MRVAIIYRPKSPAPMEAVPQFMQALGAWVEKYSGRMSTLEFFAAGGGFAVIDIDDSADLFRITAENPFTPFSDVEVRPVVDPRIAMATLQEVFGGTGGG
jgi:hypothetical protein